MADKILKDRNVNEELWEVIKNLSPEAKTTLRDLIDLSLEEKNEATTIDKRQLKETLKSFGIPASIKGYEYLKYAIPYYAESKKKNGVGCQMTKELYPAIAREFGTTSGRVERAIRHAVEVSWERGDSSVFKEFFGHKVNRETGKPTNSEFIAAIVEVMGED